MTPSVTSDFRPPTSDFPLPSLHLNTEQTWRGGELQTYLLIRGLRRLGHPAVLAAPPRSEIFRRFQAEGLDPVGINVRGEADLLAARRLARLARDLRPAVIHLHTSHAHLVGVLARALFLRRAPSPPRIVVSRRVDFSIFRHSFFGLNGLKYRFGVDRILTVSEAISRLLEREGVPAEKLRVVRSGVDPTRFAGLGPADPEGLRRELALPSGLPLVLSVGALSGHKGHRYLLEAIPRILRERDAAFLFAGEGALRADLESRVRQLGIGERVRLVGFRPDVERFIRDATIFAFPSVEEGLGTSILDALLLERPVVATRVGGIPEIIQDGETGTLVPPAEPEALARAILEAIAHPEVAARRAQEGKRRVLIEFSAERMVEQTLAAYRELGS